MKMRVNITDNNVTATQQINDNLVYIQHISVGYKFKGLHTSITGIKDGTFCVDVYLYAENIKSALEMIEKGALKNVNSDIDIYQASHSLYK